ncbi:MULTISPECIES: cellulose-binding domain-containing protein [Micromonospora]|uniref:Cellulose-binding protein n=1 Tax=Micromonospora solifontis TaxID=2487138 RepID=A0ABX9WMK2_9ACTN|nr:MULTISPECIES: cellulose-binding domain-containing protein [Micromonospora]NES13747.1 cellulose-binding protein [Micromonospora sp. PPF5-17B]NES35538.1 cellulose-binding protein [Micromonospora solifontis]NES55976.1 cellulose-binding protein [Micromonospora sp. PPF5-6]RNM00598.1 cellulose-binding protein [Micromonospora solifontis]
MIYRQRRTASWLATLAAASLAATGVVLTATAAQAAVGCRVDYTVSTQWSGGFTANVNLTNLGDPLSSWAVTWSFGAGQTVSQGWNADFTQSGSAVRAANVSYNGNLATNATVSFGFNGTWNNSSNPTPTSFAVNGVPCTGGVTPTTGTPPTSAPPTTPPPTTPPPTTPPPTTPPPTSGAVYASPNGSASAAGTQSNPTTLASAITRVGAGGTVYLRGGTYNLAQTVTIAQGNNGTASARKNLFAYPGETPILNFSAMTEDAANRGLALNGSYWHVSGLVVERAGDNGIFVGGSNNIIERTVTRFNRDTGLQLGRISSSTPRDQWPANNLMVSVESHDNADSDGEDADGFAAKLTVGSGNVFRYAVSHNNIDDGWDLYTKSDTGAIGPVTIEDSLSYNNGTLSNGTQNGNGDRNGYKLGGEDIPVNHIIQRNIAYRNGKHGFTYNRNPGTMSISNNVSIDNTERNFSFDAGTSVFRNNVSCRSGSGSNDKIVGNADSSNQFWMGSNGSRCATYSGALGWSFASDGRLVVTFGGRVVTP